MIIGTMYNYLKTQKLTTKWELKKQGVEMDSMTKQLVEDAKRTRERAKMSAIETKLKTGKKLTAKELDYLREKSPTLYKKAVDIARERAAYEKRLKACRSKEEVEKLHKEKMEQFVQEAKAVSSSAMPRGQKQQEMEFLGMRMQAIEDAHRTFLAGEHYQRLPDGDSDEKRREKQRRQTPRLHLRA